MIFKLVLAETKVDNYEGFIETYKTSKESLKTSTQSVVKLDSELAMALLNLLRRLNGPISISLLQKLTFCYTNTLKFLKINNKNPQ